MRISIFILFFWSSHSLSQTYSHRLDFLDSLDLDGGVDVGACENQTVISQNIYSQDLEENLFGLTWLNDEGEVMEERVLSDSLFSFFVGFPDSSTELSDGNWIHAGGADQSTEWLLRIIKADCAGEILWFKDVDLEEEDVHLFGSTSVEMANEDIVVVGSKIKDGDVNIMCMRINSDGDILWLEYFGEDCCQEWGRDLVETQNGGILIGGSTRSQGGSDSDRYLLALSGEGDFLWDEVIDGDLDDYSIGLTHSESNLIAVTGRRTFSVSLSSYPYIRLLDGDGTFLWEDEYGDVNLLNSQFSEAIFTTDGNLVVCGYSWDPIDQLQCGLLVKYDLTGNIIWSRKFQDPASQDGYFQAIDEAMNGDLLICGTALGDPSTELTQDTWVIRTDEFGCLEPGCHLSVEDFSARELDLSPNPALNRITIEGIEGQNRILEIYSLTGTLVHSEHLSNSTSNSLSIANLAKGSYLLKVRTSVGTYIEHLVKL